MIGERIKKVWGRHMKLIIATFEIFWIVFFLLEKIANDTYVKIPQFIYVNF